MRPVLADALELEPHPEGGWYRQTWASPVTVTLPDGRVRPTATLIYFLLPAGESSAWHRVASDELWMAHTGAVRMEYGGEGPQPGRASGRSWATTSAPARCRRPWCRPGSGSARFPGPSDALVSCLVSPGFDFDVLVEGSLLWLSGRSERVANLRRRRSAAASRPTG